MGYWLPSPRATSIKATYIVIKLGITNIVTATDNETADVFHFKFLADLYTDYSQIPLPLEALGYMYEYTVLYTNSVQTNQTK